AKNARKRGKIGAHRYRNCDNHPPSSAFSSVVAGRPWRGRLFRGEGKMHDSRLDFSPRMEPALLESAEHGMIVGDHVSGEFAKTFLVCDDDEIREELRGNSTSLMLVEHDERNLRSTRRVGLRLRDHVPPDADDLLLFASTYSGHECDVPLEVELGEER